MHGWHGPGSRREIINGGPNEGTGEVIELAGVRHERLIHKAAYLGLRYWRESSLV